jgi:hypothetical protein
VLSSKGRSRPLHTGVWQTQQGQTFLVRSQEGEATHAMLLANGFDAATIRLAMIECGPSIGKARRGKLMGGLLEGIVLQWCSIVRERKATRGGKGYIDYGLRDASRSAGRFSDV